MHNSPYTLPNSENNQQSLNPNPSIKPANTLPPASTPTPLSSPNIASAEPVAAHQSEPQPVFMPSPVQTPLNLVAPPQNSGIPISGSNFLTSSSPQFAENSASQLENRELVLLDNLFIESFSPIKSIAALSRKICSYTEILGGPRWHWIRPIFTVLLAIVFLILITIGFGFLAVFLIIATGKATSVDAFFHLLTTENTADAISIFLLLSSVAILIPCVAWATRLVMKQKLGYVSSVAGHLRWSWLLSSLSVLIPIYAILVIFLAPLLENGRILLSPRPDFWLSILVLIVICPLQTAAEEYVFRGLLMQIIGSYFKSRKLAWIIPSIISIPLFVAAHGATNPWVNLDLAIFALGATYLVWLTGGLEASIVMHFCNNFCAFISDVLSGGAQSSSPRQADQLEFGAVSILLPLILQLIVAAVITLLYRQKQKSLNKALASNRHLQTNKPPFGNVFFPPAVDDATWGFYQNFCYQRQMLNSHLRQAYTSPQYPIYQPYR